MIQLSSNYDVIFIGIIIFSAVMALIRGAVSEILSILVWILTFAVMNSRLSILLDNQISTSVTNQLFRSGIVFFGTFIIIAIVIAIIKRLCANIISSIGLGGINYILGFILGVVRGILICAILIIVIEMLQFDHGHNWQKSRIYPILQPVVAWIHESITQHELPKPPILKSIY